MSEGSVVTFYSYKGGVGRTLILASVGVLLAMWGYKVLCVDWDLEAPGLHIYYAHWMHRPSTPGLTELVQAYHDGLNPNWRNFVTSVDIPDAKEPLRVMKAGLHDDSYFGRMQQLDWKTLYEESNLGVFLEQMRREWKQEFDFILIDSRTGVTDIGGICTIQMPDFLVLLFTANAQSLFGAIDVVQRAAQLRNHLPFDRGKLLALPVATRFESRIEYELAQDWLGTFAQSLAPIYAEWVHRNVTAADMLNFTKVPYVPYWSFGEKVPVIEEGTKDPESIGFALETLAALVASRLSGSDLLISNRDSFVAIAKGEASTSFTPQEQYEQQVERTIREDGGVISKISRIVLDGLRRSLELSPQQAAITEQMILKPYQTYERTLSEIAERERPLKESTKRRLRSIQETLLLTDEDVEAITDRILSDDLRSERGVDYRPLRDLLRQEQWEEADYETYQLVLQAVGRTYEEPIVGDELLHFPHLDLQTLDRLWIHYSRNRYGFSLQQRLYLEVGGNPSGKYDDLAWKRLGDRIGWRVQDQWLTYNELQFNGQSPPGHLPGTMLAIVSFMYDALYDSLWKEPESGEMVRWEQFSNSAIAWAGVFHLATRIKPGGF